MVRLPAHAQTQRPRHPGARGSGAVPVAGRNRRAGRATGHASHGAGSGAEHNHSPAQPVELRYSLHQLPRPRGRLHPACRQRKRQVERVQRHQPQDESAERAVAARRRSYPVQQQLRRYRGPDADRRQPQGHADRSLFARYRHSQGHRANTGRFTKGFSWAQGQRDLRLPSFGRARTRSPNF